MAFLNRKENQINLKIVYYGPGRGGKTATLEYIFSRYKAHLKSRIVNIKTYGDRTLFFDFLPFDIDSIRGYKVRTHLYTVPGQSIFNTTRQLVLKGVDGIVFVADSLAQRREENLFSLNNLRRNLMVYQKDILDIPIVFQYNKRDLKEIGIPVLPVESLENDLNRKLRAPSFASSASSGLNIVFTFKKILTLTLIEVLRDVQ